MIISVTDCQELIIITLVSIASSDWYLLILNIKDMLLTFFLTEFFKQISLLGLIPRNETSVSHARIALVIKPTSTIYHFTLHVN